MKLGSEEREEGDILGTEIKMDVTIRAMIDCSDGERFGLLNND
jgi:hypothetical protein